MIGAFRYERYGQRQRFKPPEQREQDRHIHLHFHLHLTFPAWRSASIDARRVKGMLAALAAVTVIPLWLFPWAFMPPDGPLPAWEHLLVVWGFVSMGAGLALAWSAVGTLLSQAWRAHPRERLGLILPVAALLLLVLLTAVAYGWLGNLGPLSSVLTLLGTIPYMVVLFAHPLLTALLLGRVSREARALSQQAPTHSRLGFLAVAGMALLLLVELLFNLALLLSSGGVLWPLFFPATGTAILIALRMGLQLFRSDGRTQAHPKDASPSHLDSWLEPPEY